MYSTKYAYISCLKRRSYSSELRAFPVCQTLVLRFDICLARLFLLKERPWEPRVPDSQAEPGYFAILGSWNGILCSIHSQVQCQNVHPLPLEHYFVCGVCLTSKLQPQNTGLSQSFLEMQDVEPHLTNTFQCLTRIPRSFIRGRCIPLTASISPGPQRSLRCSHCEYLRSGTWQCRGPYVGSVGENLSNILVLSCPLVPLTLKIASGNLRGHAPVSCPTLAAIRLADFSHVPTAWWEPNQTEKASETVL